MKSRTKTTLKYLCTYLAGFLTLPIVAAGVFVWLLFGVVEDDYSLIPDPDKEIAVKVTIPLNEAPPWVKDDSISRPSPSAYLQQVEGVSDADKATLSQLDQLGIPLAFHLTWSGGSETIGPKSSHSLVTTTQVYGSSSAVTRMARDESLEPLNEELRQQIKEGTEKVSAKNAAADEPQE